MQPEDIIRRPIILTEKATRLREKQNQVIFEVRRDANKIQIKGAIEALFKVGVVDVNTLVMRGKERRMGRGYARLRNWKKAIVTLKQGDAIQSINGKEVRTMTDVQQIVHRHQPGALLAIRFRRAGQVRTAHVTLGAQSK